MTPPLGLSGYVFPVAGESSYVDTYGGFRGDVPGNWHHGDDIFASLGTPVLAVADGTLNRVGWQRLGGWRLWVRDAKRNQFYYAHLSGYSPLALHSRHVKAGDVIGFIGNTGDAFTTPPHLHFEIHPHQLLRLRLQRSRQPDALSRRVATRRAAANAEARASAVPARSGARRSAVRLAPAAGGTRPDPARAASERAPAHPRSASGPRASRAADRGRSRCSPPAAVKARMVVDVLVGIVAPALAFGTALFFRLRRRPS